MARAVRIRVAGGWYHAFSRGHNREELFEDDAERRHFLERVEEMRGLFGVRVYAYSYGDWGRDVVLWAARRYSGLTLAELGREAGGLDYSAVALAIRRVKGRADSDRELRRAMRRIEQQSTK